MDCLCDKESFGMSLALADNFTRGETRVFLSAFK